MKEPLTITVITKLITPNAGNQAISTELLRLMVGKHPDARIYAYWQESGLEKYTLARLQKEGPNPIVTLDKWVDAILKKYSSNNNKMPANSGTKQIKPVYQASGTSGDYLKVVKLDTSVPPVSRRIFNKGLRIARQPIDNITEYRKCYDGWLDVFSQSDWVIYSPAGAVINICADDRVRDILALRIAQRLGAKIAAVNQSVEVTIPLLIRLIGQVYKTFDKIVVRDPESIEHLAKVHVPEENIILAPDTAYLSQPSVTQDEINSIYEREKLSAGTIGIAVQPRHNGYDYSDWGKVINLLRDKGKNVIFISHEYYTDLPAGRALNERFSLPVLSRQYNYDEYISMLSNLELVISERYHTCVFSALAGVPFIPINVWQQNKMHGIVRSLEYPVPPLDNSSPGWTDTLCEHVEYIFRNYEAVTAKLNTTIPKLRIQAEENISVNSLSPQSKNVKAA
jgi:polysaccharide pyruvyl transferase WcaK-like protein